jgi:hypothetical protein
VRPILVAPLDATRAIFIPSFLGHGIVVQVEFFVDDRPKSRVAVRSCAFRDGIRAIAAVLREVPRRPSDECFAMLLTHEVIKNSVPSESNRGIAQSRLSVLEVSYRVIPLKCQSRFIIDFRDGVVLEGFEAVLAYVISNMQKAVTVCDLVFTKYSLRIELDFAFQATHGDCVLAI